LTILAALAGEINITTLTSKIIAQRKSIYFATRIFRNKRDLTTTLSWLFIRDDLILKYIPCKKIFWAAWKSASILLYLFLIVGAFISKNTTMFHLWWIHLSAFMANSKQPFSHLNWQMEFKKYLCKFTSICCKHLEVDLSTSINSKIFAYNAKKSLSLWIKSNHQKRKWQHLPINCPIKKIGSTSIELGCRNGKNLYIRIITKDTGCLAILDLDPSITK